MNKPSRPKALTVEQKLRAALHYQTGKHLSKDDIRDLVTRAILDKGKETAVSAERLVGIMVGMFYVLGHDAGNAHALAEKFVAHKIETSDKATRPRGKIEDFAKTMLK